MILFKKWFLLLFLISGVVFIEQAQAAVGRFVRVEIPGNHKILSLAEVEVFEGGVNIAPKGKVSASSDTSNQPQRAIDGNSDGNYGRGSVTHSKGETNPWLEIDLLRTADIESIKVHNRSDCCGERLNAFTLKILDNDRKELYSAIKQQGDAMVGFVFKAGKLVRADSTLTLVACVGDSITFGAGIPNRNINSYPAQLNRMLGDQWIVHNFGRNSATLLTKGDLPYIKTPQYAAAISSNPNVVVIKLGTNDTKPNNWQHKADYVSDYVEMINVFKNLESSPEVWICYPVPVYPERWGITDKAVREEVIPLINEISKKADVKIIDLYAALSDKPNMFPDKVHPNTAGAGIMAKTIAKVVGDIIPKYTGLNIWDNIPAKEWTDAYPVGNGRLGAMPFANFPKEKILINEETIWEKPDSMFMAENSFEHLEKVRELEASGDYRAADDYFEKHISGGGSKHKNPFSYQLLGWLNLEYKKTSALRNTYRELDMETGVARNIYRLKDGSKIIQEVFASTPDDVVVVSISADKPITLEIALDGAVVEGDDLVKVASADGKEGTQFVGRVRVVQSDKVEVTEKSLLVKDATEITFYLSASTNFDYKNVLSRLPDGWQKSALGDLDKLKGKSLVDIKIDAIEDHRKYFSRVSSSLGTTAEEVRGLPTRERLDRIKKGMHDDPELMNTYFQFGRYLLIASSRPGCFPANLQGLWNPHKKAPWGSDYHLNINIQMNYWLAETTNLSEMHRPFMDLIRHYQIPGKDMARRLGMKGWCMGHSTDIWGSARLMGNRPMWAGSFFGGQWMTFHILEHYRFNRDKQYLATNWDILTASVEFVESWLIPGPDNTLMARPASSPENSFKYTDNNGKEHTVSLNAGNSYDQFMILQVLNDYVEAAKVLDKLKDPFVEKIQSIIPRIYKPRIAEDGRLMEWRLPFKELHPGHRHISHVIGAYPGNQINLDEDPQMRDAVIKTIEGRLAKGGAGTGWSRAWTIGMFARFSDADRAYENLHAILSRSTIDNLWDSHPPFQIDGNFGSSAAIAEMLLHSHNNEIKLLPALPKQWPDGYIKGLRARGDYTVSIQWKKGELLEAVINAGESSKGDIRVIYKGKSKILKMKPGEETSISSSDF